MRLNGLLIAGLVAGMPLTAVGQEPPAPAQPEAPATPSAPSVDDVIAEYNAAQKEWIAAYRAARKAGKRGPSIPRPNPSAYATRVLELAGAADADAAVKGLTWVVQNVRSGAARTQAVDLAKAKYLAHAGMGNFASSFSRDSTPAAAEFLKLLMSKTPDESVKGKACFALANALRRQASTATFLKGKDAEFQARYARTFGQAAVDAWLKADPAALEKEAEGHFEKCVAQGGSVAKSAERELYELRNLSIGKTAPDIVGADPAGEEFKLSDYRGKVVVIDFWGDW